MQRLETSLTVIYSGKVSLTAGESVFVKVYIHFGPPKSGTSVIQNWLTNNQEKLQNSSIYYPGHRLDPNGISSGNLEAIFDRKANGELSLNKDKQAKLLREAEELSCESILLSSEFFFERLDVLATAFPEATFIGYIRFPLDGIESAYSQSIKRNLKVKPFKLTKKPRLVRLDKLNGFVNLIGRKHFILRLFDRSAFVGGDLVKDFLTLLSAGDLVEQKSPNINSSYSFEAMEFKRWLNQFDIEEISNRIDLFLQSYNSGERKFTLLTNDKYLYYRKYFLTKMEAFCLKHHVDGWSDLKAVIEAKPVPNFRKQEISSSEFERMIIALKEHDLESFLVLGEIIGKDSNKIYQSEYKELLTSHVPQNLLVRTKLKKFFVKIMLKLKHQFRRKVNKPKNQAGFEVNPNDLREALKIPSSVGNADILREVAMLFENNNQYKEALTIMRQARELKPGGKIIRAKLREYKEKLAEE